MNSTIKKLSPYLLILLGLFLLIWMNQALAAGICLLLGIVMVFEQIWPERWGAENK